MPGRTVFLCLTGRFHVKVSPCQPNRRPLLESGARECILGGRSGIPCEEGLAGRGEFPLEKNYGGRDYRSQRSPGPRLPPQAKDEPMMVAQIRAIRDGQSQPGISTSPIPCHCKTNPPKNANCPRRLPHKTRLLFPIRSQTLNPFNPLPFKTLESDGRFCLQLW